MSEHVAQQAMLRMNMREVAVATKQTTLMADLRQLASCDPAKEHAAFLERREELCRSFGLESDDQRKPFAFAQGIALIPVTGSLINRFGGSYGYVTGYNFIRAQVAAAGLDPDVKGIIFDMNSYGGEAAGCFECAADIPKFANGKPTMAVVDSNCYSACYALASQCDKIVVTPSGGVGSVGVVAMHVNVGKVYESFGYEITFIFAGDHKVDGNPFESLSDEVKADMQASIDKSYNAFVILVASGRKLDEKVIRDTQARTYRADDALRLGLIDEIATPQQAVSSFYGELSGSKFQLQSTKETEMADADIKPGADQASAQQEARKAERARIQGIQSCEEAKGREALANHLALNTEMSVDDAKAILAAAPVTAQAEATNQSGNAFEAAMERSGNPKVGADDNTGDADESTSENAAASILKNFTMASGFKPVGAK
jgi:capsid assembly protease